LKASLLFIIMCGNFSSGTLPVKAFQMPVNICIFVFSFKNSLNAAIKPLNHHAEKNG